MSRCFPFPPPGYEKKIPTAHSDLLKKEKHREKKHKKEKKDKEKKEDKEKNVKDKSDGKNRDKKDKKEKHRDKKKGKVRDKDQQTDNPTTLGETRHKFQPEGHDGQNVIRKDSTTCTLLHDGMVSEKTVGYNEGNHGHHLSPAGEINGAKFVPDVDRSTRYDAKIDGGQMREKITTMDHKRNEGGGTFYQNSHLGNNFKHSNLALELDRRLNNEAEQPYDQNQTANKFIGPNKKKDGRVIQSVYLDNIERGNNRIMNSGGRNVGDKYMGDKTVPYSSGPAQGNHDKMPKPSLDSNTEKKIEGQERINHQEDELQPRGKKRKDKERNGERKDHGKDKSRDKERKEDKGNSRIDQKSAEQGTRQNSRMDILCAPNKEMLHSGVYRNSSTSNDEKLNLAKELLTNGISHVTGPNKLSRPSPSFHLHNENGRMPEPRQIPLKPSPDGQGATNIFKVDKVGKVNGINETLVQRPATEQVIQAPPRSPHPDANRLIEILSVPKIEELSEINDSDWLISSKEGPEKKHKVDGSHNSNISDTPQVWSEAANIESADVYALPYVIPY